MWQLNDETLQPSTDAASYNFCSSKMQENSFSYQKNDWNRTVMWKGEKTHFKLYVHSVTDCCICVYIVFCSCFCTLVWFLVKSKNKGFVGVEMLLATAHSRRISCRLQNTIPPEIRAKAWTVAGFYRRCINPPTAVQHRPAGILVWAISKETIYLWSKQNHSESPRPTLSAWVALMNMKDIP